VYHQGNYSHHPVDKILLEGEPSSPAVDAIHHAVGQASHNVQPTAVFAASPSMTTTVAQTLAAIAQQQPVATAKPLPQVTKAFRETLRAVNHDVSVIEASPFPTATALGSPKISVLREVHLCGGLVINFLGEEPILSDHDDEE
uniref:Uncharacterized protein n=1 Tax=Romanomermis culicivorax TaxID=13658 RepID=A0A915HVT7_ROMCU